jgi:uncharacterized protein GlcG (DUF336 family)
MNISLSVANEIIEHALKQAEQKQLKRLAIVVCDAFGHLIAFQRQDDCLRRFEVPFAKASGALFVGMGSRGLFELSQTKPLLVQSYVESCPTPMFLTPGGVLIKSAQGKILGAVGVSGDTGDNDELLAIEAIQSVGLVGDGGGQK